MYYQKPKSPQPSDCIHCKGKNHDSADCYFKSAVCRKCNKTGHIIRARGITGKGKHKFKARKLKKFVRNVDQTTDDSDSSCEIEKQSIYSVIETDDQPILLKVGVNGIEIPKELDTGSAVSVMSEEKFQFREIFGKQPLKPSKIKLRTYSGEKLKPVGVLDVKAEQKAVCELYIVEQGS